MRDWIIIAGLVFVGGAIAVRPAEGQFITLSDPCYETLAEWFFVLPYNPAATWSDPDSLGAFAVQLREALQRELDGLAKEKAQAEELSEDELEESTRNLAKLIDCLPRVRALIYWIDEQLKKMDVGTLVVGSGRDQQRLTREELIKDCQDALDEYAKRVQQILKSIGR